MGTTQRNFFLFQGEDDCLVLDFTMGNVVYKIRILSGAQHLDKMDGERLKFEFGAAMQVYFYSRRRGKKTEEHFMEEIEDQFTRIKAHEGIVGMTTEDNSKQVLFDVEAVDAEKFFHPVWNSRYKENMYGWGLGSKLINESYKLID